VNAWFGSGFVEREVGWTLWWRRVCVALAWTGWISRRWLACGTENREGTIRDFAWVGFEIVWQVDVGCGGDLIGGQRDFGIGWRRESWWRCYGTGSGSDRPCTRRNLTAIDIVALRTRRYRSGFCNGNIESQNRRPFVLSRQPSMDDAANRIWLPLDQQMNVIGHQAIGVKQKRRIFW